MKGFRGKLLVINLNNGEIADEPLDEQIAKNFLGGAGYCCKYLYDKLDKNTDPLSPENILMFMTGPLCGSTAPTSGRFVICAKSPLTGIWGESNCGGFFGPELKKAGYDGIIINGSSIKPIYIEINNDIKIKDAGMLWGKGILETSKILKERLGSESTRVACIGPAGENLVRYAIVASEEKAAGRTGMGAVMGSKKLKAIAIRGAKMSYTAHNQDKFKVAIKNAGNHIKESYMSEVFGRYGTSGTVDAGNAYGDLPIKYWTVGKWDKAYKISGVTAADTMFIKQYHCFSCPIGCAHKAMIKEGEYKTEHEIEAAEYETVVGFGSLILNDNLESIQRANYLCNDYGIDTISGSGTIAFIYYIFNNQWIKSEDIDGLEPNWGNFDAALKMIEKIAYRKGIGNLLAEGSDIVGKHFNISQDEIATVYGMEVAYHDLRHIYGMAVAYALGTPRGPCHESCDMFLLLFGSQLENYGIKMIGWKQDDKEMAIVSALTQDYRALYNSMIMCNMTSLPPEIIIEIINSGIGLNLNLAELKELGERIYMMKRMFNLKMGITPADDRLPQILLNPVNEGGAAGDTPNFDKLKKAYYEFRTFDLLTGYPNHQKLKFLGLDNLLK
ncbi:MAG: aldehyde ferredoxin oxidoreductase family protein, partial [Candidatus Lokiarchaeia archaeon]|nr:aldehyde ferredoxin oxidoreductase family protein [Candidatus Lokiarchaeia archaeon]